MVFANNSKGMCVKEREKGKGEGDIEEEAIKQ